jgi:hypothetical protein
MKTTAIKKRRSVASEPPARQLFHPGHLTTIRGLLSSHEDVREGRMFGLPAFFAGRRMFACIYGDGVGIKVPASLAASLLERSDTESFRPYGKSAMREWVQINHTTSSDYEADLDVFLISLRFVTQGRKGGNANEAELW